MRVLPPPRDTDQPRLRAQAVRFLGIAGDTEYADAVRAALDDPDPAVRQAAGRALTRLGRRLDLPGIEAW